MLVGIMGKMGSGKTLSMSILSYYLGRLLKSPVYANYNLEGSTKIQNIKELMSIENGIICFDEIWLTMDSRLWKDNVFLTQWINQTRKKKLIVFYTTQHIRQVELRARNGTDYLIYTEKKPNGIWLNFVDYQYMELGRRLLINKPEKYYNLYNTYEVLKPLQGQNYVTKTRRWR